MAPQQQIREIKIKVDTGNSAGDLKSIADGFGKMNQSVQRGTGILEKFSSAYRAIAGISVAGFGITSLVGIVDSMQKLNDKLRLTEGSAEKAKETLGKFQEVAAFTKSSIEDTSLVYTRMSQALSDLGANTDSVLGVTLALQNSFRVSGSTAAEARSSTIQFSQALASGQLRGQELRSVLESNVLIGKILADTLKVNRGELLKYSENNGGIKTSQVLKALADNFDLINTMAANLTPTIGESLTMAFDKLKIKIGEMNQEGGYSKKVSEAIMGIANNLDTIFKLVSTGIGLWVSYRGALLAVAAMEGAYNLAMGVRSALWVVNVIGVRAFTAGLWAQATAQGAVLATLGPIGIALALAGTAYVLLNKEMDDNTKKIQAQKEAMARQKDAYSASASNLNLMTNSQIRAKAEALSLAKQTEETATMTGSKWREASAQAMGGMEKYKEELAKLEEQTRNMKGAFNYETELGKLNTAYADGAISLAAYNRQAKELKIKDLTNDFKAGKLEKDDYDKKINEAKYGKSITSLKQYRGELGALNKEWAFAYQSGDISGYAKELDKVQWDKLERDLKQGRISFNEFNKGARDLALYQFNRQVIDGTLSFQQYRNVVSEVKLKELNQEWRMGRLAIGDYHKQVAEVSEQFAPGSAFYAGVNNYVSQAGTLSQNVANVVTSTFGNLETYMVDFTKNGKFAFADFAKSVLDDLNKIIIRSLIIQPLAKGILGAITPSGQDATNAKYANTVASSESGVLTRRGASFDGRASFFANGGVVHGATPFSYGGGGKLGVMGEKGPEAILPLRRDASGDLGVKAAPSNVIVNVINQGGGEVQQSERQGPGGEKIIDVIVMQKVKEAFASGSMDKQMNQQYGLRRKGI